MGCSQEREHVDVAVPEHVTAVPPAGQPARSDRRLPVIGYRCDQVKQREAYPELQLGVTVDVDIGVLPPRRPCTAMFAQHGVEPELACVVYPSERRAFVSEPSGCAFIGAEAIEDPVSALAVVIADAFVARRDDRTRRAGNAHPRAAIPRAALVLNVRRRPQTAPGRQCGSATKDAHDGRCGPSETGQQERLKPRVAREVLV
jgi:hypothetical protein